MACHRATGRLYRRTYIWPIRENERNGQQKQADKRDDMLHSEPKKGWLMTKALRQRKGANADVHTHARKKQNDGTFGFDAMLQNRTLERAVGDEW